MVNNMVWLFIPVTIVSGYISYKLGRKAGDAVYDFIAEKAHGKNS